MNFKCLSLLAVFATASFSHAQWQTTSYPLKAGWNAIYLTGDAKHGTIDSLFPASVVEVWRWNPNPTSVQFTQSPLIPSAGTPEWSVWRRGLPAQSSLSQLSGQTSYLVKCAPGTAANFSANLLQATLPPQLTWVRSGANLMGFPTLQNGANSPLLSNYFATFPVATAANTKIFKYVGGDLGPANPLQVFSPANERMDRTRAYWFSAEVVGNFYAPLEVTCSQPQGLTFGRTGSVITTQLRNRTSAPVTINLAPVDSEAAPAGQPSVTGRVPLTRRTFNTTTLLWDETPITAAFTEVIGPQSTVELAFGVDRGHPTMTAVPAPGSPPPFFASFLRLTDSGNLFDISLPVSASRAPLVGLWVGDISLKQAGYTSTGAGNTPREFPLRTLLHVADDGTARLLSQVFLGQLSPGQVGLCTRESRLKQDNKANAQRLVAAHLPLDQTIIGSGSVAVGNPAPLVFTVQVPFDDRTNPFVHQYHPDHDNKNPRGAVLANPEPEGKAESYDITRTCAFSFTATPPPGSTTTSGWGSSVIGGTYTETITGLVRNNDLTPANRTITLAGTFELRRASEDGALDTAP